MALHLNVITWYKSLSGIQFSSIPIHIIFHIQNLEEIYNALYIANNIATVGHYTYLKHIAFTLNLSDSMIGITHVLSFYPFVTYEFSESSIS